MISAKGRVYTRLVLSGMKKSATRIPAASTGWKERSAGCVGQWRHGVSACSHDVSLEHILLFYRTGAVIDRQGADGYDHENEDADGGRQGIIVLIHGQLVQPGDQ